MSVQNDMREKTIAWAMQHLGDKNYAGWCLSFVEDAIEKGNDIEVFGGDSARESYLLYRDAIRTGTPERGAVVFYDCLCKTSEGMMDWGHCGIALDNGQVIHAWNVVRIDDYLEIEKLSAQGVYPGYLGWVPLERVLAQRPE